MALVVLVMMSDYINYKKCNHMFALKMFMVMPMHGVNYI